MTQRSYIGAVNAPDFPPGLEWLDTDNHAVRVARLDSAEVTTLELQGLP